MPSVVIFRSFRIAKMAPLRGAGQASFDATFEMDSDDKFSGFYAKNVELAVTVYSGMATDTNCWRIQSTKPPRSRHLPTSKTWTLPDPTTRRL